MKADKSKNTRNIVIPAQKHAGIMVWTHPLYNGFAMSHDEVVKNHIKQKRMGPT
jgi:hypothetical protein